MIEHIQEPQNSDDALECITNAARFNSALVHDLGDNILHCSKENIMGEVAGLMDELQDWRDSAARAAQEMCGDERHCTCVGVLRHEVQYWKESQAYAEDQYLKLADHCKSLDGKLAVAIEAIRSLMSYQGIIYNAGGIGAVMVGERAISTLTNE